MNAESLLVAAIVLGALSSLSASSALIEGRRPRVALFALAVTAIMFAVSVFKSEDGFQLHDIPDAFVTVVAGYMN
ncbi:MAG: hypothetical protein ACI8YI_002746 [Paracoccaceae bacterium]|jgi:hypothetical protein